MKYCFIFLVSMGLTIFTACQGFNPELREKTVREKYHEEHYTYYLKDNQEILHGLYYKKNMNRQLVSSTEIQFYLNGKTDGIAVYYNWFGWMEVSIKDGVKQKAVFYDYWGRKVAECTVKDDLPYNGTGWSILSGIGRLRYSTIVTYKNGKPVSEEDFEFDRFSDLFNTMLRLHPRIPEEKTEKEPAQNSTGKSL